VAAFASLLIGLAECGTYPDRFGVDFNVREHEPTSCPHRCLGEHTVAAMNCILFNDFSTSLL
jgi:hypothetical protein